MAAAWLVGTEAIGSAAAAVVLHEGGGAQIADGGQLPTEFVAAVGQSGGISWIGHGAAPVLLAHKPNNQTGKPSRNTRQLSISRVLGSSLDPSSSPRLDRILNLSLLHATNPHYTLVHLTCRSGGGSQRPPRPHHFNDHLSLAPPPVEYFGLSLTIIRDSILHSSFAIRDGPADDFRSRRVSIGITPRVVLALTRQGRPRASKHGRDWLCDQWPVAALDRPSARHPGGRPRKAVSALSL